MLRRTFLRALTAIAAAAFSRTHAAQPLDAGGGWQSPLLRDHPLVGQVWDAATGRFVSSDALVEKLKVAHFRLLGEVHDNPDHHGMQTRLLDALGAAGRKPLVAFEQFDSEFDAVLQKRLAAGTVTAEEVATVVHFNRKGWNWELYRPLVETALHYGMPLRAANLSRATAAKVVKEGLESAGRERIKELGVETAWSAAREQALRKIVFEGHCHALPDSMIPAMAAAQRMRDAVLAQALLSDNPHGAILIAGNGHVRRDLGVPLYLAHAMPEKSVCTVGIVEVHETAKDPRAYVESIELMKPRYDFLYFTPRWERPDPCAGFKRPTS